MSSLTLYALADELIQIQDLLEDSGGELTPEIEHALDGITGEFDGKAERICHLIQTQLRASESAKAEARRLDSLGHSREQSARNLKQYLMAQMQRVERLRIDLPTFRLRIQANGGRPRIEWTLGTATLPPEFRRVEIKLDSDAAYNHWKAGGTLPDGFTIERGHHLRIE